MKPTVGRIVHFQSYGTQGSEFPPQTIAALVTDVREVTGPPEQFYDGDALPLVEVDLAAFYPNGLSFKYNVRFAEKPTPGRWNWPPRS